MVILLTGASGFIGARLSVALRAAGHVVIEARRSPPDDAPAVRVDFTHDLAERDWLPRLAGVDMVINAVGILREHGSQTFERIHTRAPIALFSACAAAGVRRVIQISALGAERGQTGYFASKRAADEFLATLPLDWTIVRPSLVYGPGGTSARLFEMFASLPVTPLPGRGDQLVQPIHVDDLIAAIVSLVERAAPGGRIVPLVGPEPLSLRSFLAGLRSALGMRPSLRIPIPLSLMRAGASVAQLSPHSLLDRETLAMLQMGAVADAGATRELLGRNPREVGEFVPSQSRAAAAMRARLSWLLPTLRVSIAIVWLWTGVVSLGLYPRSDSYLLLERAGVSQALAPAMLLGAALFNLALGFATLLMRRRRILWLVQIALILTYTAIITFRLPEFWLHPYGPLLKNLPMLAAIYLLYEMEAD